MGASMATCVVAGFGLGWLVDTPLRTFPIFALVGLGLGVGAACVYIYKLLKRFS